MDQQQQQQQQHEQPPPPTPQQHNDGSSPMMMMDEQQQPQQQPQQYSASQPQPTTSAEEDEEEEEEEDIGEYEDEDKYLMDRGRRRRISDLSTVSEEEEEEEEAKEAKRAKKNEAKVVVEEKVGSHGIENYLHWFVELEEEEVGSLWIGDLQQWMDEVEKEEVRKLWIGDLQHWMDEDYIHRCFAHTGEVFTSKVIRNKKTNECYGFILFKSHAIAERFLHKFNGTPMPKVVGINFRLNWASSLQEEEEEEDDMLQQETVFASVKIDGTTTTTTTTTIPKKNNVGDGAPAPQLTKGMFYYESGVLGRLCVDTVNQGGSKNSGWEIMLKCWRWAQADETSTPQTLEAAQRVHEIHALLEMDPLHWKLKGVTSVNIEELLDELQGYVGLIDVAEELHSVNGLDDILDYLYNDNASIRAKVAKLIGSMEHNNHNSSQQLVMKARGLDRLFCNFFSERDATAMTNTIDAISLVFRKNRPTITAFTDKRWYGNLKFGLRCYEYRRRTLNLIQCLVLEHNLDCSVVTRLGFHHLMMCLASSVNAEVQKAALGCLLVLVEVEGGGNSDQKVKNDEQLKQVLQELIERISATSPEEDRGAAMLERRLVDLLWNACYNEPSSLREGLLVLPCDGSFSIFSSAWPSSVCCYSHFSNQFKLHQQSVKSRANFLLR